MLPLAMSWGVIRPPRRERAPPPTPESLMWAPLPVWMLLISMPTALLLLASKPWNSYSQPVLSSMTARWASVSGVPFQAAW